MADTAIVILLGQSLNVWRGANELVTGDVSARMLVGGGTVTEMDFSSTNLDMMMDWNETTSAVTQAETTGGQSPIAGMATTLADVGYSRIYFCSVAVGSRGIADMHTKGQLANMYGAMQRFIALAAAAGDVDPEIFFYSAHGEFDATLGRTTAEYVDWATQFYQRAQLAAAQCLGDPAYIAPIILSLPAQNKYPTAITDASDDIAMKTAMREIADSTDIDNIILYGSIYHWQVRNSDWTHPTDAAYVLRGEAIGKVIADYIGGTTYAPLRMTSVTLSGSEVTVQFTHNIQRDVTTMPIQGTNGGDDWISADLTPNADGFEYYDNGSEIAITGLVYGADTVTLTLATTPVGTAGQQEVRLGVHPTTTSTVWYPEDMCGAPIRKDMTPWASTFDPTYDNYDWALQEVAVGLPYTYTPPAGAGPPAGVTIGFSNGFAVTSDGALLVSLVAADYAEQAGDVYINGTRCDANGIIYATTDAVGGSETLINGIAHSSVGVRYIQTGDVTNKWPEGFATDSDGRQAYSVALTSPSSIRSIARESDGAVLFNS